MNQNKGRDFNQEHTKLSEWNVIMLNTIQKHNVHNCMPLIRQNCKTKDMSVK